MNRLLHLALDCHVGNHRSHPLKWRHKLRVIELNSFMDVRGISNRFYYYICLKLTDTNSTAQQDLDLSLYQIQSRFKCEFNKIWLWKATRPPASQWGYFPYLHLSKTFDLLRRIKSRCVCTPAGPGRHFTRKEFCSVRFCKEFPRSSCAQVLARPLRKTLKFLFSTHEKICKFWFLIWNQRPQISYEKCTT